MAGQTTINGRPEQGPAAESAAAGVGRNVSGLVHDLISLGELQCQLMACNFREGIAQSRLSVVLIVCGVLLALGAVPVVLLGIGWSLIAYISLTQAEAFLVVGLGALCIAALAVWWGWKRSQAAWATFTGSRRELVENLNWVKRALQEQSGGDTSRRRWN